jgi:hypothetical protein
MMGTGSGVDRRAAVLLKQAGLAGVRLHEREDGAPAGWLFSCEEPDSEFESLGGQVLFQADLMVDESDDYDSCRVERVGELIVASRSRVVGRDATYVGGSVAACEAGSDAEKLFIADALDDFMQRAVGPVASIVEAAKKGGLKMSEDSTEELVKMVRSLSETSVEA